MRVALVSNFFLPFVGGIESYTAELARSLMSRGVGVVVVRPAEPAEGTGPQVVEGIPVSRVRGWWWGQAILWCRQLFRVEDVDVVHFQGFSRLLLIRTLVDARRLPVVVTTHGGISMVFTDPLPWRRTMKMGFDRIVFGLLGRRVAALICLTEEEREHVLKHTGFPASRIHIVNNPVPDEVRAVSGLPQGGSGRLLVLARGAPIKRIDDLIRVVLADSSLPAVDVAGPPGEATAMLRELAGGSERIRFLGSVRGPAKVELLRGAQALVLCSAAEGQSISALEALAQGTPVVASISAAVGLPDRGVVTYPTGDLALLAARLRDLAQPALRERLRAGATESGKGILSREENADRVLGIYRSVM